MKHMQYTSSMTIHITLIHFHVLFLDDNKIVYKNNLAMQNSFMVNKYTLYFSFSNEVSWDVSNLKSADCEKQVMSVSTGLTGSRFCIYLWFNILHITMYLLQS